MQKALGLANNGKKIISKISFSKKVEKVPRIDLSVQKKIVIRMTNITFYREKNYSDNQTFLRNSDANGLPSRIQK